MATIIIIAIIVIYVIFVAAFLRFLDNNRFLVHTFETGNVIVAGRKRKGKDVLFCHVIKLRNKDHYSNIHYDLKAKDYKSEIIDLRQFNCGENNFLGLIQGLVKCFKPEMKTKQDLYISDSGIYLPSQEDSSLSKIYKGLPITYALSGHLYEANIHANTQRFKRLWIKLREQADHYILVKGSIKLPKLCILLHIFYYDREETAYNECLPFKGRFLSSDRRKVAKEQFEATNGIIQSRWIFVPWKTLQNYDTHELRKTMFTSEHFDDNGSYSLYQALPQGIAKDIADSEQSTIAGVSQGSETSVL